jgi:hypothetical protein
MRKAVGRRDVAFLAWLEDLEARRHFASVQSASLDAHLVGCACGTCAPYRELPETQLPPQPPPAAEGKAAKGSFKNKDFSRTLAFDVTPTALITPTAAQTYTGPLTGKIVYVSGGHGYHWTGSTWTTGRSEINEMIEDLGNQDQLAPYADYLLRAGATVVPMRPIGHQLTEFVLDNDSPGVTFSAGWSNSSATSGFFGTAGDVPYRFATVNVNATATATYAPTFSAAQAGFYPVYAWTRDGTDRAIDQTYRINHAGGTAEVKVNHQLVGEGWIYLGTYYFAAGSSGNVQIINKSIQADASVPGTLDPNNVVIADAVRFGNGMGSVTRGGAVSGRSREDEASLYWLEAANGVGTNFTPFRGGSTTDDNANVGAPARYAAFMNNAPFGQALYMGFHSNAAGGRGSLGLYNSSANATPNQQRWAFLAANEVNDDLVSIGVAGGLESAWFNQSDSLLTLDRSDIDFGEISDGANEDEFDATILEVAYHDDVTDAQLMRDPKVRDWVGRATYQATVRYFNEFGGGTVSFAPAAPTAPRAVSHANGNLVLSWTAPASSAANGQLATSYTVMMSRDGYSFGVLATGVTGTSHTINAPDLDGNAYYFKVVAVNAGGQSPGSVVVGGRKNGAGGGGTGSNRILVINGFDRLERTLNFRQTLIGGAVVDRVRPRFSNSFDYVVQAGEAIEAYRAATGVALGFDSAQNEHVINGQVNLANYRAVIWLSGEESTDHETFGAAEQTIVSSYLAGGGRLFVSGAEVGWDLDRNAGESAPDPDPTTADRDFYEDVLRSNYVADDSGTYTLTLTGAPGTSIFAGLSNFSFDNGALFYNAEFPDRLGAINGSTVALNYSGGTGGAAALQWSDGTSGARLVSFGFPFETITTAANRTNVMTRVLDFFQAAVSAAPQVADLDPGSDSGTSTTDDITRRNNAGAANNLTFTVPGTVPGATVRVFADGLLIGQAVAAAATTSTTVVTNGSVTLLDGTRNITATQEEPAKSESAVSVGLPITIDTVRPSVTGYVVNDGALQRSRVTSLTVTFDSDVVLGPGGAFTLVRSDGLAVTVTATGTGSTRLLTFSGAGTEFGSLADGLWELTVVSANVSDASGNQPSNNGLFAVHRYFGDADGDRDVDGADSRGFRAALDSISPAPAYNPVFDFDGDGDVDGADSRQFRARLDTSI